MLCTMNMPLERTTCSEVADAAYDEVAEIKMRFWYLRGFGEISNLDWPGNPKYTELGS